MVRPEGLDHLESLFVPLKFPEVLGNVRLGPLETRKIQHFGHNQWKGSCFRPVDNSGFLKKLSTNREFFSKMGCVGAMV